MLIKLSWKNIWRNPMRSGSIMVAVLLGTWASIFLASFFSGMYQQHIRDQLRNQVGHLQIHASGYTEDPKPELYIEQPDSIQQLLSQKSYVTSVSRRTLVAGLASSSANNYGVKIAGVNPQQEQRTTAIHEHIVSGTYFDTTRYNPAVIGQPLAERLKLEIGSRVVFQFQDLSDEITAGLFHVSGIYSTNNQQYDQSHVFVERSTLSELLGRPGVTHEFLVMTRDFSAAGRHADSLQSQLPALAVQSWKDASPMLSYMNSSLDLMLSIFMGIIVLALTLGIVNTMLMAVLERTGELGMLMAIGMNRMRIFAMILWETFLLTITSVPVGLLLAWGTIRILQRTGIDLSAFAEGLRQFGFSTHVYPIMEPRYFFYLGVLVGVASILAAIYPAWKALKLNPVEAIRKH